MRFIQGILPYLGRKQDSRSIFLRAGNGGRRTMDEGWFLEKLCSRGSRTMLLDWIKWVHYILRTWAIDQDFLLGGSICKCKINHAEYFIVVIILFMAQGNAASGWRQNLPDGWIKWMEEHSLKKHCYLRGEDWSWFQWVHIRLREWLKPVSSVWIMQMNDQSSEHLS